MKYIVDTQYGKDFVQVSIKYHRDVTPTTYIPQWRI